MEKQRDYEQLYQAVLSLQTRDECAAFFEDLFTIAELNAAAQRVKVADMLYHNRTCGSIAAETGESTATVSRVNKCMHYGPGGYKIVLDRINGKGTGQ